MCEIAKVDGVTKRLEKARLHLNQIIADPSIVFAVNSNQLEATQQQIKTLIKDISKKDKNDIRLPHIKEVEHKLINLKKNLLEIEKGNTSKKKIANLKNEANKNISESLNQLNFIEKINK